MESVNEEDQLVKIMERIKLDKKYDFSFNDNQEVLKYQQEALKYQKPKPKLSELFPKTDPELVQILTDMLQYNAFFRPSAKHLLKNKIFD
jgi:hypothetical protein